SIARTRFAAFWSCAAKWGDTSAKSSAVAWSRRWKPASLAGMGASHRNGSRSARAMLCWHYGCPEASRRTRRNAMPKRLTPEDVERYHRDGFICPIDALTPEEVAHYRGCMEAFEASQGDKFTRLPGAVRA